MCVFAYVCVCIICMWVLMEARRWYCSPEVEVTVVKSDVGAGKGLQKEQQVPLTAQC